MNANGDRPASRTSRTSPLAIAALVCGIVQFGAPPAFIAAIILGHRARRQIRQTGEGGYGIATAGLILGYFAIAATVMLLTFTTYADARGGAHGGRVSYGGGHHTTSHGGTYRREAAHDRRFSDPPRTARE